MDAQQELIPEVFEAYIGGYWGVSYHLVWDGSQFCYSIYQNSEGGLQEIQAVTPSTEHWLVFWKALDKLGVWNWQEQFEPEGVVCDGFGWNFEVKRGEKHLKTGGSNATPDYRVARKPVFKEFCRAISKLIEGRDFS